MDCIADLQQIYIRNFPAATKNYLFREMCHDDLFVSACLQKCSVKNLSRYVNGCADIDYMGS